VRVQIPREIAFRTLRRRDAGEGFVERLLEAELAGADLTGSNRALAVELTYGAVRWQATLDWLIDRRTSRPPSRPVRLLLWLGLYQLFWLDRVPAHAAVHETVALTRQSGYGRQAGFVNALLRAYAREHGPTRQLLADLQQTSPAVGWSHPAWLVARWTNRWGSASIARLLAWNNTPARTFARVNTLRAEPERLLERWRAEGVAVTGGSWDWVPERLVFELTAHPALETLGSFQDGWFYVQDPSTLLAVELLEPQPGDRVLDACAAPGGKATYLAQRVHPTGTLRAEDVSAERLALLRGNAERLGVCGLELVLADCDRAAGDAPAGFHRVLVDVPCSNTGVLRRRVDARWRLQPAELERLAVVQGELLERAAARVVPGGALVYSTCSLEPEENGAVVARFLAGHPEYRLETERELCPFVEAVDGAYAARLRRAVQA